MGLGLSLDDLKEQLNNTDKLPKFQPIVIKPESNARGVNCMEPLAASGLDCC